MSLSKTTLTYLACTTALLALACLSQRPDEFAAARAQLLAASAKADSAGIVQARGRFEKLLQSESTTRNDSLAAWTHYYIAFANWQLAFATSGNREHALKLMQDALAHLVSAMKLKENLIDAYVVLRRCQYWLFTLDPSRGRTLWPEGVAALKKAQALAPNHPLVLFEEGIDFFYKPPQVGGDQQKGIARFQAALAGFKQETTMDAAYKNWWRATTHMMHGQAQLGLGNVASAEQEFQAALKLEPEYAYIKNAMLPMTRLVPALALRDLSRAEWLMLAHDSESDGANPAWAAVKTLSYVYDRAVDTLWFKLDLSRLPNPNAFGINLVVDTDEDQSTGANWWGGNRAFKYDRLVTVWVVKNDAHSFRGAVGIGDFHGASAGLYLNLQHNNLVFRADSVQRVMLLGLKSRELDEDGRMNLIAAVGSNAGWNDDVPDSNYVRLQLK